MTEDLKERDVVRYVARFGGFCRDCADEDGICPSSGLPCDGADKAIEHVLKAVEYGETHGFLETKNSARIAALERHVEELQEKNASETCACSYDSPGDVCMGHSPTVARLKRENARLREALDMMLRAHRTGRYETMQTAYEAALKEL